MNKQPPNIIYSHGTEYIRRNLVGEGSAERYWEGRYRDEKADNERLRFAVRNLNDIRQGEGGTARVNTKTGIPYEPYEYYGDPVGARPDSNEVQITSKGFQPVPEEAFASADRHDTALSSETNDLIADTLACMEDLENNGDD